MTTATLSQQLHTAFPYEVERAPLYAGDGSQVQHFGLFRRPDDPESERFNDCVGAAVKKGYTPHTRADLGRILDAVAEAFPEDGDFRTEFTWRDGHRILIEPTRAYRKELADGSQIWPVVFIDASYNGTASGSVGLHRDTCANLMRIDKLATSRFGIRHTARLGLAVDEVCKSFRELGKHWPQIVATAQQLDTVKVVPADMLAQIFGPKPEDNKRAATNWEKTIGDIGYRIRTETDNFRRAPTAWTLFNAVQGWSQHDRRRVGELSPVDRVWRAIEDRQVAQCLDLMLAA